jgi:predicted nucleic acid-binding protein
MTNTVLVDSGFTIALFDPQDPLHASAKQTLRHLNVRLRTVWPVIVETSFFLGPKGKVAFLRWIERGAVGVRTLEVTDMDALIVILDRYADQRIDLADACLIWLAGQEKTCRVLTTDRRDFSIYRTPNGQLFERVWLTDEG